MEFIDFQAKVDDSDDDNLELDFVKIEEHKNFGDNTQEESGTYLNFYRKFHNQSREICYVLNNRSDDKLDIRDLQPKKYWEIDRSVVEFDEFDGYEKAAEKFKKSLCS